MTYFEDLRAWINELENRGKLRRVTRRINKDTELHPLVRWQYVGLEEKDRTGFLFENLSGINKEQYAGRVASSVIAPTHESPAIALGLEGQENVDVKKEFVKAGESIEPTIVDSGPVKDEIHVGDELLAHDGLDEFPIPFASNGWELLPRITAASWHTKDPETGLPNLGIYNAVRIKQDYTNIRISSFQDAYTHWQKASNAGEPLDAAAVIGGPPVIQIVSAMSLPSTANELNVASAIVDTPIPLVQCETVDLAVPATAEVVLEGQILPRKETGEPSGEHTGYMLLGGEVNAFQITGITHRENPIWLDMLTSKSPTESSNLHKIRKEIPLLDHLQNACGFEHVKDVRFTTNMGSRQYIGIIQLQSVGGQRPPKDKVWSIAHAVLGTNTRYPKILILVDEDIGIDDIDSILWAVTFRSQPHRDIKIFQGRKSFDQSVAPGRKERGFPEPYETKQGASVMVIDATLNWDYTPVSLPKREFMERAKEIWEEELELGELSPITPWHGYSLGEWPDRLEALVELANTGAFDEVGERLMEMEQAPWL